MPTIPALATSAPPAAALRKTAAQDAALHKAAEALEASFLAEMLRFAGAEKKSESFGGGIGEEQFASFLGRAQAEAMVKHGGIGLARKLYAELKDQADGTR